MIPSNTICVSQEGPANALALNKDCSQVVIAGRNVFKVFSIGENEFTEVCNLRVGKNLNLNFSSIDVAWSHIEENTIATAATNGAVVVWNLGRSGRSKQEHVFSDHKRTVNKVSFHLTEPALLISGSQDGTMKCFDLRMKEVARTFMSNTESVRDVQFSPHQAHQFAAVSENGSVQLWDVRRPERAQAQFTAHSGPVFACDWHPELPWLATASRDKTIKVWDISAKPTLEHTIYTIASVGHVKWRPQRKYQISSCALVLDCAVHVWDVRRPHVPLATFAEHRDVTTAIAWRASPHAFLSTSRDCSLYWHRWQEAAHPVLWGTGAGASVSARGQVTVAAPARPIPRPAPRPRAPTSRAPPQHRKQPIAGALSAAAQAQLERLFPAAARSELARWQLPPDPTVYCAKNYRLRGAATHELAEHNARVARHCERHLTAHLWDVIAVLYSSGGGVARGAGAEGAGGAGRGEPPPAPQAEPDPKPVPNSAVEEEPTMQELEEWAETQFHNSGVLGLPTHSIYIPPARRGRRGDDDPNGWVSAASAHYVDVDAADWTLPEEAFPLRAPPPAAALSTQCSNEDDTQQGTSSSSGTAASPGATSADSAASAPHYHHHHLEENLVHSLAVGGVRARAAPDLRPLLAAALKQHAALGDVGTAASAMLVLQQHRSDLFPYIDEPTQEQWLLGYIELLHRHKLYNVSTEVILGAWLGSVRALSQQSTSVSVVCARCGRRAPCDRCKQPELCAVCVRVVRGLYAWCQGCSHGGHLHHMQQWMEKHTLCPAGCGHRCQLP
ncbi:GATOR complex protein WDR24 [Plutella xylostella]|uniref:GATOR complex protein WDR24 n=1 Tax=Plutella xylostella TaxID=51655 RepID=UPI002032A52A|nr:GATOR complex protein WDR24 [Plutella xylostella]